MLWSAPVAFWFALSLLVILVLHGIKLFRRRVPTSTLFIWRQIAKESQTSFRLERIVHNLPLLLQLLLAALLVLALAQPLLVRKVAFDKDIVLVVDASASMNARAGDRSRFDLAREKAEELIDSLSDRQKMALVAMERAPRLVQPFTEQSGRLKEALAGIAPTDAPAELKRSLLFALSLAKDLKQRQVILIGDGAYHGTDGAVAILNDAVTFIPIEGGTDNIGITRFAYRPYLPPLQGGEVLLTVRNFTAAPREVPVSLEVGQRRLLGRSIALESQGEATLVVPVPAGVEGIARALVAAGDDFPTDDQAFGVLVPPARVRVAVVGEADPPLRAALKALPDAQATYLKGQVGAADAAALAGYDLVLFNRQPPPSMERGTVAVFGAVSPQGGLQEGEELKNPRVTGWNAEHPLLAYLDPQRLRLARARALLPEPGTLPLIEGEQGSLLAMRESGGLRVATVGFDLNDPHFTADEMFPLFIANLVRWARPGSNWEAGERLVAGDPYLWRPKPGEGERRVTGPDGRAWPYPPGPEPIRFDHTEKVGIYTLESGGSSESIAVNLLDPDESSIARNPEYVGHVEQGSGRGEGEITFDGWPWLVLVGAIFLLVEWLIWNRFS